MKDRIYICHTYYHVYVTFLKELKLRAEADPAKKAGAATLVLSKMSNNFENLKSRVESTDCSKRYWNSMRSVKISSRNWKNTGRTPEAFWGI